MMSAPMNAKVTHIASAFSGRVSPISKASSADWKAGF